MIESKGIFKAAGGGGGNLIFGPLVFLLTNCTGQIEASTSPPPGIPWEFDSLLCPGSREFDSLSLRRGGELENRMGSVGNLNKLPRCHVTCLSACT